MTNELVEISTEELDLVAGGSGYLIASGRADGIPEAERGSPAIGTGL